MNLPHQSITPAGGFQAGEHGTNGDLGSGITREALGQLAENTPAWTSSNGDSVGEGEGGDPGFEAEDRGADDAATLPFNPTDLGNAERLVSRHGENLRYCHPWKKWL